MASRLVGEWLAHGEWCDVRLLCRGGMFSAHRAVLASASPYLRCILVSHIEQETPIYIILPDIDWEAMSPVLYYIYNGEINVPLEKLSSFFEIINTLKIFIDKDALEDVKNHFDDKKYNDLFDKENDRSEKNSSHFIKLEFNSTSDAEERTHNQNVCSTENLQNKPDSLLIHKNISYLNTMQNKDGDLHQNSLLRDSVTEPYSRNSITNRLSPNVSTITNECNLQLLSGGVMNGNKNIMDSANSESVSAATTIINEMLNKYYQRYNANKEDMQNSLPVTAQDIKLLRNMLSLGRMPSGNCINNMKINKSRSIPSLLPIKRYHPVDLSKVILDKSNETIKANIDDVNKKIEQSRTKYQDKEPVHAKKSFYKIKSSPLNQSPWNPRQPRTYRPLKIKQRRSFEDTNEKDSLINKDVCFNNDKNNNLPDVSEERTDKIIHESAESMERNNLDDEISSTEETSEDSKKVASRARHTCGECGKSFSQLRNYKYHLSVHRGTKEFAATCTICGKYFNDRGYLSSHMKIHRNQKEYQCTHCPKSFNQRVAYNMHIRIHTGVKPHVCEECGKAFSRKMLLKQHQRTHSGERPYACSFCDKRFADRSNMTLHMRLHSGVKPFACTLCPKSFTKKHHLKTHLNFHTGAKPYACPRCNMTFSQSSNMRTHLKKCTVEASTT